MISPATKTAPKPAPKPRAKRPSRAKSGGDDLTTIVKAEKIAKPRKARFAEITEPMPVQTPVQVPVPIQAQAQTKVQTLSTDTINNTFNVVTKVEVRRDIDTHPEIAKLLAVPNIATLSTHYMVLHIQNTNSTTCNFIRQHLMNTPTYRLYAAYSETGVNHNLIKLTCKFCPFWQYIIDNIKLLPIAQTIEPDTVYALHVANTTMQPKIIYSTDIRRVGSNTSPITINKYQICEISPGSELHLDNIVPILATSVVHASHNNVCWVSIDTKSTTNELLDDTGDFTLSFKILEGILPREFIVATFANITTMLGRMREFVGSGELGIVRCNVSGDMLQYTVKFSIPLSVVQYVVRILQDRGINIGSTMNPDEVSITAYRADIMMLLTEGCDTALQNMRHIEERILSKM